MHRARRWAAAAAGVLLVVLAAPPAAADGRTDVPAVAGLATASTTAQADSEAATQAYIVKVYLDLFGRAPDPVGLHTWTAALKAGTPYEAVANAITASDEYRSRLIRGAYQHYLGREPDAAGLANWLGHMRGSLHIEDMQAGFIASDEFWSRGGSTPEGWVSLLYQSVLGRGAGPAEVASWVDQMSAGASRTSVAGGFLYSTEHLTAVVDEYYVDLLGRHIDPSGRASWVSLIQAGHRDEEIIAGLVSSAEYRANVVVRPPADATAPGPVTDLTVTGAASTTISLAWTNPPAADFTGVVIRRSVGATAPATPSAGTAVTSTSGPTRTFVDTGLTPATTYSYAVFASDAAGNLAPAGVVTAATTSAADVTPPGLVTGVVVTGTTPSSISLVWTNPTAPDLAEVVVRRAVGTTAPATPAEGTGVNVGSGPTGMLVDNQLAPATTYSYALFARDTSGNVAPPARVTAGTATIVDRTPPAPVTGLAVTASSGSTISLGWTNPPDADLAQVVVRRAVGSQAPGSSGDGTPVATATPTSAVDTGLTPGASYSYAVVARDAAGNESVRATVTALAGPTGGVGGTVVELGGAGRAIAGVRVTATSTLTGAVGRATTSADGTYAVTGLPAAVDYRLCFDGSVATGGSSDDAGYLWECNGGVSAAELATPVAVAPGGLRTGVDVALAAGGALTGTVTDADGRGLTGVTVNVGRQSVVTGASGAYRLAGLAGGRWSLCVDSAGASGGAADSYGYEDGCGSFPGAPAPFDVVPGTTRPGVDVSLVALGGVTGTVRDSRGNPLAGVVVTGQGGCFDTLRTVTGPDGTYVGSGLRSRHDCSVVFDGRAATGGWSDAYGYGTSSFRGIWPSVLPGATQNGVDGDLQSNGVVVGTVTDDHGRPVSDVMVSLGGNRATSRADGTYAVRATPGTGQLGLGTSAASGPDSPWGYVPTSDDVSEPVQPGAVTQVGTTVLTAAGSVTGRVTDDRGNPLGNVWVSVRSYSVFGNWGGYTGPDGSYAVGSVPPATDYSVCFDVDHNGVTTTGGWAGALRYVDECYSDRVADPRTPVAVASRSATRVDAALGAPGRIAGRVTDAMGHPLAGVVVRVESAGTGQIGTRTTAADGTYAVTSLMPAPDYRVCFDGATATGGSDDALAYLDECYDPTGTGAPVPVPSGGTSAAVDASLAAAGAIVGTVTDALQHPLAAVNVSVVAPNGGRRSLSTGSDGSYVVADLVPGEGYRVWFQSLPGSLGPVGGSFDDFGYTSECYDDVSMTGLGSPVAVVAGVRARVDASLAASSRVAGTVTDATGHPLARARVTLRSATTAYSETATTWDDGAYAFTAVPPAADYQLCTWAGFAIGGSTDSPGYASECYEDVSDSGTPTRILLNPATATTIDVALASLLAGAVLDDAAQLSSSP